MKLDMASRKSPGIVDADGNVRSVVDLINDWDGEHLTAKVLGPRSPRSTRPNCRW